VSDQRQQLRAEQESQCARRDSADAGEPAGSRRSNVIASSPHELTHSPHATQST
jgi:hypothetical protein